MAARWWRTGDQTRITRAGSPLTFWKLQQVPVLWTLDRLGYGAWIDDPIELRGPAAAAGPHRRHSGSGWSALALVGVLEPPAVRSRAMVLAAWWFALSPNLLAHGPLVTMEMPILAAMTGMMLLFWVFLRTGDRRAFVASAVAGRAGVLLQVHGRGRAADLRDCSGDRPAGSTATAAGPHGPDRRPRAWSATWRSWRLPTWS